MTVGVDKHSFQIIGDKAFYYGTGGPCTEPWFFVHCAVAKLEVKSGYTNFNFQPLENTYAVRSVNHEADSSTNLTHIIVIGIDGDTLSLTTIYECDILKNKPIRRKKLNALGKHNHFQMHKSTSFFVLPGFYKYFGNEVIFELPHDSYNKFIIHLGIPSYYYVHDYRHGRFSFGKSGTEKMLLTNWDLQPYDKRHLPAKGDSLHIYVHIPYHERINGPAEWEFQKTDKLKGEQKPLTWPRGKPLKK